jgi:hypothetical protein
MQIAWADQLGFISLVNCNLENLTLAGEFASDIDVAEVGANRERRKQTPFEEKMCNQRR